MSIASQMPSQNLKPQFALKNLSLHKSHSINKFATTALQKSDNKEGEQSEDLDSIKPIFDTNSRNQHKFSILGAKLQIPEYKYNQPKKTSVFDQSKLRIHPSNNHSIKSISKMTRTRAEKSTPTRARVTFSDNSLSNTTPATNTYSNTKTTSSVSAFDTSEDMRFTDTLNRIFSKKL